ncbi:peptidoglycan-binding protein [Salipaludibacillus sp. LMS25]|jgi:peptidoglycan hydrolase-like protein with peptidoglycan-binding domain|uniref:C40 family peptidase n=1 Tax=Salipaludibacillus sp. LMS25 TaxID=2924031 RepID=UPI0020D02EEA|nr:peptidoglycan-binding protein [Salipaludibacillus sp. LMS25]UTR16221.1 peptidoglycan-binding protein [Salipaludibacillus sp. LMS25]
MSFFESKVRSGLLVSAVAAGSALVAPNLTEASFGEENLRYGMKNEDVKILQEILQEKGYYESLVVSGDFDEATREAVKRFQTDHNLSSDGVVGPLTFSVLNGHMTAQDTSESVEADRDSDVVDSIFNYEAPISVAPISNSSQIMDNGTRNDDVSNLQAYLKKAGFYDFPVITGNYGNMTKQAVTTFQTARALKVDGLAGPITLTKVNEEIIGSDFSIEEEIVATTVSRSTSSTNLSGIVLRQGSRGAAVRELQSQLKDHGYFTSNVDGVYGPLTAGAVRRFQQDKNISADGIFGPQTYSKLSGSSSSTNNSTQATSSSASSSSLSGVVLRQGSSGSQVRELQTRLKNLGYYTSSVDGAYGPLTAEAVRKLQRQTNIAADGVFGPQTLTQLNRNISANQSGTSSNNSSSSSNNSSATVLKQGSSGAAVRELQNMLRATGHHTSGVDGQFGPLTKSSVQKFQREWGLIADGIATKATLDKLEEVAAVHMSNSNSNSGSRSKSFNAMNLIADASNYIGVPYVWGGTTASGFDCSGFVQHVFRNNGVNLPRTVAQQWNATTSVSSPSVGDIVYFETYKSGPSHNGIYIGNNQFIHSGSSTGVVITSMNNSYWKDRYIGARRAR